MIHKLKDWYKKRKRAVLLGDMGYTGLWCDPRTGKTWQANSRWSIVTLESHTSIDESIQMLKEAHLCELLVEEEWPNERTSD